MRNNKDKNTSNLIISLKDIVPNYKKPEIRNDLVPSSVYEGIDDQIGKSVKLGNNGVLYVEENAFPTIFQTLRGKAAYIFENQISDEDKRVVDGTSYAHSSAVVGLVDKKSQETRDAAKQAAYQYSRDSLLNISDSPEAQNARRQLDALSQKTLPKLRNQRGVMVDEITGEDKRPGFAFHHVNPKEIHTDPEDTLDPTKGRNLNPNTHNNVHRDNILDEKMFDKYKKNYKKKDNDD